MRVAVIGAGMAGLGAARTLQKAGVSVVVFEKSRAYGGRVATRRIGDYTFDHGATIISPRGSELERVILEELPQEELVLIEKPIFLHADGRVSPVDPESNTLHRYAYQKGVNTLGKLLGADLDVRFETPVEKLSHDGPHYVVNGESYSHVILTAPLPQSQVLLETIKDRRQFAGAQYRKCLSVMFGIEESIDKPYHALLDPNQSQPLTWLSIESIKVPGTARAPEGCTAIVAQMSARYSRYSFERSDEDVISETWFDVKRLLGIADAVPMIKEVKRWKYSHAANTVSFESVNKRGERLLIAGDGIAGARTHQAYLSGIQAAEFLLSE